MPVLGFGAWAAIRSRMDFLARTTGFPAGIPVRRVRPQPRRHQLTMFGQNREPVVHALGIAADSPMLKEVRGIAQGKPSFRGMNLQVKRQRSRLDRRQSRGHDLEKTLGAIQRRQRIASVVFERNGNLCEKAQVSDPSSVAPTDTPQVLLEHHLKQLRLPTFLGEYDKVARQCAAESVDYPRYLLRLTEQELLDRERRATERRIHQARFPVVKSLDTFEFLAIPAVNKALVLELARCEFLLRRENVLLMGNSGTGKTHLALALGLSACQRGHRVRFTTTAAMVHELLEARDEKRLLRYQKQMAGYELLIVDELGFVPLSKSGAELLFEVFSQRYERGSTLVTSNLPFQEWTEVLGSERLTGALLDRLTHHVHILEMNGESYRLKQSKRKRGSPPNS